MNAGAMHCEKPDRGWPSCCGLSQSAVSNELAARNQNTIHQLLIWRSSLARSLSEISMARFKNARKSKIPIWGALDMLTKSVSLTDIH